MSHPAVGAADELDRLRDSQVFDAVDVVCH
jgi:hypothetical protein